MRGESENSVNLFAGDAEFLHKLLNAHVFDIFKDGGNRCPGTFEYPCAASLAGNAFNGGTLGPVERCHVRYPSFIVVKPYPANSPNSFLRPGSAVDAPMA